jgi:outer membrane immunogenic protein
MKRLALIITLATLLGAHARAADVGPSPYTKAPAPVQSGFDWTGVYVGGHLGGGWQSASVSDPSAFGNLVGCCFLVNNFNGPTAAPNMNGSSFLGGGQIGTMYQVGRLVVGVDADWSSMRLNGNSSMFLTPTGAGAPLATDTYSIQTNWTATSTATVGLARDRWMIYGKAGVAWENTSYGLGIAGTTRNFGANLPFAFGSTSSSTDTGWTAGAGGKWAFWDNWFVNLEYDYLDFGTRTPNLSGIVTGTSVSTGQSSQSFTPIFRQNISEVKLGLSYKFAPGFLFW